MTVIEIRNGIGLMPPATDLRIPKISKEEFLAKVRLNPPHKESNPENVIKPQEVAKRESPEPR